MLFGCPKSCGLCGTDGKICSDFYEFKCPIWRKEGNKLINYLSSYLSNYLSL
jgi:hypothetical protein